MDIKAKLYEYELSANETLFKGMDSKSFDMKHDKPVWFSQKRDTAAQYGAFVHKLVNTKPLKLINITSPYFQSTFMDFLNDYYRNETNDQIVYEKKMKLLVPIGLPDESQQKTFLSQSYNVHPIIKDVNKEHYKNIAFFYNHHRFSEKNLDINLVKFLKNIHLQYQFDGYIAPCVWPSKYHNRFSDEICIFDIHKSKLAYVDVETISHIGGGSKKKGDFIFSPATIEKITMSSLNELRYAGWEAKYELDEKGMLLYPDSYTLQEYVNKKHAEQKAKEILEWKKSLKKTRNPKP
jgi:hypothetical protein